jgi:endonuclease YncB( thermonuclease family)
MLIIRSLLVLALLSSPALAGRVIEGAARVIDGDTVEVAGERVRLFGIDAPEAGQICDLHGKPWKCGSYSAAQLAAEIGKARVSCKVVTPQDRHGRPVAICRTAAQDLGAAMVRSGAATAYARYSDRYADHESEARAARRGLWQARMVTPEAERAATRPAPGVTLSAQGGACKIKGNISSKGERIYHLPGQKYYDRTRIDKTGEAMFCTEKDARAAGFRRSKV